ncbi:Oxysterol-binding protein 4 [Dimargaris cristalligena]|nr:Oxysterol-binding protein 4 [Dimargaris cristalligena]
MGSSEPSDHAAAADQGDSSSSTPKVPSHMMGEFYGFLKNLGSFTGDLSALTCPSFLLSGDSVLEYCTHWCDQPSLFSSISDPALAPEARMVAVCRWFISTLYGSYYARAAVSNEKKPFNPILGEQLVGTWDDPETNTQTRLVCEQVSHHPPVSAVFLENAAKGIFLNAHTGQKSKFTGTTIKAVQTGYATLHLRHTDEVYTITFPDLYIRSLITGKPFMEIVGSTWIRSNRGYVAVFKYIGKPWFGGEYHRFKGSIYHVPANPSPPSSSSSKKNAAAKSSLQNQSASGDIVVDPMAVDNGKVANAERLYTIEGRWMAQSTLTNVKTGDTSPLFDATSHRPIPISVVPITEQGPLESRRVWQQVAKAINEGDFGTASAHKSEIENHQRQLRKERKDKGEDWVPEYFRFATDEKLPPQSRLYLDPTTQAENGRWIYKSVWDALTIS